MESIEDLQKRANEAANRFVATEAGMAAQLLARAEGSCDAKERVQCVEEARATIALISRVAGAMWFPDSQGDELWNRIRDLRDRMDRLSKVDGSSCVRRRKR